MDARHVFGTSQRIFLNVDLGCTSACSYCYLPQQGLQIGRKLQDSSRVSAADLIEELLAKGEFVPGRHGTVLSIGCFSETWDPENRAITIELVMKLAALGNPIQVATKRQIKVEQLRIIAPSVSWDNQITFYISTATISRWRDYEEKTEDPKRRFESLRLHGLFGVGVVLYIKPVLTGITILDIPEYSRLIKNYPIPVVVGDRFDGRETGRISAISNSLYVIEDAEAAAIRKALSLFANVYENSLDVVDAYRRRS